MNGQQLPGHPLKLRPDPAAPSLSSTPRPAPHEVCLLRSFSLPPSLPLSSSLASLAATASSSSSSSSSSLLLLSLVAFVVFFFGLHFLFVFFFFFFFFFGWRAQGCVLWICNHNCYGHHWLGRCCFIFYRLRALIWCFFLPSPLPPPWFVSYFSFDGGIGVRWERKGKEVGRRCGRQDGREG